jgi:ATP-dependent helicase/nuclease subunit A
MPSNVLTPSQESALDIGHHLAVTANAGSGKTRVLVERYCRLIASGATPQEILVLTYTEKAAAELQKKIALRLAELKSGSPDTAAGERYEDARIAAQAAPIGTIHSFCARTLREFPVEAGVDAAFSVVDELEASTLREDATAEAFRVIVDGKSAEIPREGLMELIRRRGKRQVRETVDHLLRRPEVTGRLTDPGGLFSQTDDAVYAVWREAVMQFARGQLDGPDVTSDLEFLCARVMPKNRAEAKKLLDSFLASRDSGERVRHFESLRRLLLTQKGGVRKIQFPLGLQAGLADAASRTHERGESIAPVAEFLMRGCPDTEHETFLRDTRLLLAVLREVAQRYRERKAELGGVDFDDLQLLVRNLIRVPAVKAQLGARIRFIMIDEFQDTNPTQLEILFPLLSDLARGNLFVVGDPKQSIYRFRQADVRMFLQARDKILIAPGGREVVLRESFRLLRDPAATVNWLFASLMHDGAITYDPLVVAREATDAGRVEILLSGSAPEGRGGIEPFESPQDMATSRSRGPSLSPAEANRRVEEEDLIARKILKMIEEEEPVLGGDGERRPLTFRDIAVLMRTRSRLFRLEHAFIRAGIPYAVAAGSGFYQTQDVRDLANYLRFLNNPADDIALAGTLRSPFFTVPDDDLLVLGLTKKGKSLWECLDSAECRSWGIASLDAAREVLGEDLVYGVRLPVSELLARIFYRSNLPGILAGTVRGPQAIANMEKLFVMAREFESGGFMALHDFTIHLNRRIEEQEREGQAAVDEHLEGVRVMTIHAAKGLEFPVVIVPNLDKESPAESLPYLDSALGIALPNIKNEDGTDAPEVPITSVIMDRARRDAEDEERRVFYVACTRARDRLILSGTYDGPAKSRTWLSWLEKVVRRSGGALDTPAVSVDVRTDFLRKGVQSPESHRLVVPILHSVEARPAPRIAPGAGVAEPSVELRQIDSPGRGEIFSASKIRTYAHCPAQYRLRYILGFPLGSGPFARESGEHEGDTEYPAELRGRLFHAVMEHADRLGADPEILRGEVTAGLAREAPLVGPQARNLSEDVVRQLSGLLSSTQWQSVRTGTEVQREFSISAALGEDFITGTIDRLYRAADGVWTVLDYKTDSVTIDSMRDRADQYWPQLRFYAVMVRRLHNASRVRLRIIFSQFPEAEHLQELDERTLALAESEIAHTISKIKRGEFSPSAQICQGCPFGPGGCSLESNS